ncbi:hypothetical protein AV654_32075 [Paenibacillus elgii]|uniref:Uncharacterized protein n=1 Tax=Paenibacillus elgii TaxID=189691 RepID=A0A163UKK7_9BACL|nr:hypothetical protein [Paenibacillus elgii]KZE73456.1 hypothetical protein AV654_32075 [Paenibacillus elgii]
MIQIADISDVREEKVENDEYIPINVKWRTNERAFGKILYWRTGDFRKSLCEMGISEVDGSIVSFTLTLVDKGNVEFTGYPDIITPPIEGCPRFKTDGLFNENGYFDDKNDIKVGVSSDSLRIFFEKLPIASCVRNGRIMFGLTERKSLAMIEVSKMNKAEYERLLLAFD